MNNKIVNCWNSIGVWGRERPRCPVLESVIHCQNCDKYIDAGRQVLAREVLHNGKLYGDEEQLIKYSEIREEKNQNESESVMVLRFGDEWFAIPSKLCMLVSESKPIHSVPHQSPHYIKGIVNISGEVHLCFSLDSLLGVEKAKQEQPGNHRGLCNCLIVVSISRKRYVFPASEFRGLYRYNKSDLLNVPSTINKKTAKYLIGVVNWNALNVGCIDASLLFSTLERKIQ